MAQRIVHICDADGTEGDTVMKNQEVLLPGMPGRKILDLCPCFLVMPVKDLIDIAMKGRQTPVGQLALSMNTPEVTWKSATEYPCLLCVHAVFGSRDAVIRHYVYGHDAPEGWQAAELPLTHCPACKRQTKGLMGLGQHLGGRKENAEFMHAHGQAKNAYQLLVWARANHPNGPISRVMEYMEAWQA